jgi:hypothetical protein
MLGQCQQECLDNSTLANSPLVAVQAEWHAYSPAADRRAPARSVRSQEKSGSSRPKCP